MASTVLTASGASAADSELSAVGFDILGSLEGRYGGSRLRLGGPTQERVLVTLLLEAGRMVPVSRLVDAAWDDEPPQTAVHQVRKAVAALRGRIPGGAELIVTDGVGYRAVLDDERLDLHRFTRHSRLGREAAAAGRTTEAVTELRAALDLWRGPVLGGAGGPVVSAVSAALEERRTAVAEQYHELCLELGEAAELVGPLRELVAEHPLRETPRGHLMLALYRSGRQAEALEEYGRIRDLLVEELGIDPGPGLTRLHEAILRDDPEVAGPARPEEGGGRAGPSSARDGVPAGPEQSPRTLPYDLPDFTGRDGELRRIVTAGRAGARILGIDGMGGSGKTALAVHAAHRLAEDYPDGQLFVDLRGFSHGEKPQGTDAVIDSLLRSLGVPDDRMPDGPEPRLTLWRDISARRRLLLLLDNAVDAAQVRPLLPASGDCLVLVTSRLRLLDLDGAEGLSLERLSHDDSTALLARVLGADRTAAEPDATDRLVRLCGGLPLALRITAARLRGRPRWTVRYLVDRLADETRRLREFSVGERGVEATLRLSYLAMEEGRRAGFRLLAEHPGGTLDVHSAAALLGSDLQRAEDTLEHLLDAHLLEQPEMGRYGVHDLVSAYATTLRGDGDDADGREAVRRLVPYYVTASGAACDLLFPGRTRYDGDGGDTGRRPCRLPDMTTREQALGWFGREHEALHAVLERAGTHGLHRDVAVLARNHLRYLNLRGHHEESGAIGRLAVTSARQLGDPLLLRRSLADLAIAHWWLGSFPEGVVAAEEALRLAPDVVHRPTQALCLDVLGLLLSALGDFERARACLEQSIALHREIGVARGEAEALSHLSSVLAWTGRYADAARHAARATELNRRLGDRRNEITSLTSLALSHLGLGEDGRARTCLARALDLCDESLQPGDVAFARAHWARLCQRLGQHRTAAEYADHAMELVSARGVPLRQAAVANVVGPVHLSRGEPARAMELHRHAHRVASTLGHRIETARALHGMSQAAQALGNTPEAHARRRAARELYEMLGVPEAGRHL
ncbi:BTAD domain-containing putative transcriptional regulator [Streptomyces massasporeus]|uniref:BTAD domain-containing putative transcriptional regulator n=1 Tax=Streptomyces massasporeus TaxID=67324 RepID=A0ABW6LJ63_9ACTN